ncbi:MAG: cbb3-type cytochrome c oxidase subunit I [Anaerolineales bacterium]|nr:cbb3-type cytochrome c oxidase subunit I [Anaerolineales bacterium]
MRRFFGVLYHLATSALAKGLLGQLVTYVVVYYLIMVPLRTALGYDTSGALDEPSAVIAGILSVIGFLISCGVVTDWLKWTVGQDPHLKHGTPPGKPAWTRYFNIDVNHKVIGIQYGFASIFILLVGGLLAIIFRLELAAPGLQFLSGNEDTFNTLFSAHGIIMIASIFAGIAAMINYLAPMMIGATDMAFPRLNAFSYWVSVPAASLLISGIFLGGWDTGWVGYPTHSTTTQMLGIQFFLMGFWINGFSSIAGGLNLVVTVAYMRAKGMTLFRMPIFVWAALAASILQATVTQTVGISLMMVIAQRSIGLEFFTPVIPQALASQGVPAGDPILFQHLFWFYSHPAVYVWILPGLGVISELLPVFSRKPLFGYKWIALSSIGIALVGSIVWAHHMFTSAMPATWKIPFMISTLLVAVPTGVKFFSWLATIWEGKLVFPTPMLFVLGAISVFLLGGLSGPILGTIASDMMLHDSYFVVGHFHATIFGGFIFPFFAAIYYWYPKITGRMYNEALGKLHFWLMVPGFWVMSLTQMRVGLLGMRRRIADYGPDLGIGAEQALITVATLVIGWSILIMIYNLLSSFRAEAVAGDNPWGSRSPEWQTPSPIPEFNYLTPIEVVGDPYDYGLEGATYTTSAAPAGD